MRTEAWRRGRREGSLASGSWGLGSQWGDREREVPGLRLSCAAVQGAWGSRDLTATAWGVGQGCERGPGAGAGRAGWGAPMEGGVQCPGIRDSPAPIPRPPGPRDEPDQGQGSALTSHPRQLGRDGHRGRTLPLRGPSFPRARPGEEAHGKVDAGGREVRAAWAPCRRPRAARARGDNAGLAPARGARAVLRLNGRLRPEDAGGRRQAVAASPVTLGPFRVSGADCASSLRGSSHTKGALVPHRPFCAERPLSRRAVYAPVPAPRRIQPAEQRAPHSMRRGISCPGGGWLWAG